MVSLVDSHTNATHLWDINLRLALNSGRSELPPEEAAHWSVCSLGVRFRARRECFKRFEGLYLKAKARILPWLSYMCHIRL